jgi:RNA polymerase sigma factor (sigma-70 family)
MQSHQHGNTPTPSGVVGGVNVRSYPFGVEPAEAPPAIAIEAEADFDAVYRREVPGLVRLAYLMTGSRPAAEELVNDVFCAAWPRWDTLLNPAAYLRTGVVRRVASWRARAARARARPPSPEASTGPPELDETWQLLQRLPAAQRIVLVLRFYADLPDHEIAAVCGCRPATVRTRIHRGLARLRQELQP